MSSAVRLAVLAAVLAFPGIALAEDPPRKEMVPETKKGDPMGPVRVGAIGGVGFPRPLSVLGMIKVQRLVSVGLEYSMLPDLTISGVRTSFNAWNGDVRYFPLKDGFFFGLAAGEQHLGATTTVRYGGYQFPEQVTGDTWFVEPRIGFLSTASWGFTVGIDAGLQIPVAASFVNTIPQQLPQNQQATDVAHLFGKNVLPTIDLLRLGVLL